MLKRTEYKNIMKDYLKKSNTEKDNGNLELAEQYKESSEIYDMNQKAVKVINNGIYGATSSEAFRLFQLDIAEAITTTGQMVIKNTINIANEKLNEMCGTKDRDYVITTDTDSIIFFMDNLIKYDVTENRKSKLEEISKLPVEIQKEVNEKIQSVSKNILYKTNLNDDNNFLNIKNEWLANSGLFVAKKCYVIHQVFKEGIAFEQISPTGINIKRSSTPKAIKSYLQNILDKILSFKDKSEIDEVVINECKKLKEYDLQDIALPCGINDMDEYDKTLPIHVRGTRIYNNFFAPSELEKISSGKVKYIYVSKWDIPELNRYTFWKQVKHPSSFEDDNMTYIPEHGGYIMNNWVWDNKLRCWKEPGKEYVISLPNDKNKWDMISKRIEVDYKKMKERLIIKPVTTFYEALGWDLPTEAIIENNGALLALKGFKRKEIFF